MKKLEKSPADEIENAKAARGELIYKSTAWGLLLGAAVLFASSAITFFQPITAVGADEGEAVIQATPVMDLFDGSGDSADASFWQFHNFPFRIEHGVVPHDEVENALFQMSSIDDQPASTESSRELFEMVTSAFQHLKSTDEIDFYGLVQPDFQLAIATQKESQSVLSGAIAYPQKDGYFTLIRLLPVAKKVFAKDDKHLLPMDEETRTVCSGLSSNGSLSAEVVETESDIETLIETWKKAGWIVEQFQSAESVDQLIGCHKDDVHLAVALFKSGLVTGNAFLIRKVAMTETD